jgi:hypothetical protein
MIKIKKECFKWGIRWAIAVLATIIVFLLSKIGTEKFGGSGIIESILLITLILLTILTNPLEVILEILPGNPQVTLISCKITGCINNFGGLVLVVLLWFILGSLFGLIVGSIKDKLKR